MKNLKFESLDLDKFKENELDNFKIAKVMGGQYLTAWYASDGTYQETTPDKVDTRSCSSSSCASGDVSK